MTQAMTSSRPTAAKRISKAFCVFPAICSRNETSFRPRSLCVSGCILCPPGGERIHFGLRLTQTGFSFRRPITARPRSSRDCQFDQPLPSSTSAKGQRHPNVRATGKREKRRPLRAARKIKFRRKDANDGALVAIDGNGFLQQRWITAKASLPKSVLINATGGPPGTSSSRAMDRPSSGITPSASKNPSVTPAAPTRSGSPPSARSAVRGLNAAILAKLSLRSRHSATSALAGGAKVDPI